MNGADTVTHQVYKPVLPQTCLQLETLAHGRVGATKSILELNNSTIPTLNKFTMRTLKSLPSNS